MPPNPSTSTRIFARKPNLFLIGAMKSGTNYLRKLLNAHPAVFMCDPGEPSYFVAPSQLRVVWPDMWRRGLWKSANHYLALFSGAGEEVFVGEASTTYTRAPLVTGVAEKIRDFSPDARFIYLMRDPVERTISHYWHMVRNHTEHRSLLDAVRRDEQFTSTSHYARQARPFLECFGRERMVFLTHEMLVHDPRATMNALCEWLGIDQNRVDEAAYVEPENVTPATVRFPLWGGLPRRIWQSPPVQTVARYVPAPVENALRRLAARNVERTTIDMTETIAFLRALQQRQTAELSNLLGRDFPEWTTLNGGGNRWAAPRSTQTKF